MHTVLMILGVAFGLGHFGAWITIMMDAFEDEIWKGILCLAIPIYCLYYGATEFDHDKKWLIFLTYLFGGTLGMVLWIAAFSIK